MLSGCRLMCSSSQTMTVDPSSCSIPTFWPGGTTTWSQWKGTTPPRVQPWASIGEPAIWAPNQLLLTTVSCVTPMSTRPELNNFPPTSSPPFFFADVMFSKTMGRTSFKDLLCAWGWIGKNSNNRLLCVKEMPCGHWKLKKICTFLFDHTAYGYFMKGTGKYAYN